MSNEAIYAICAAITIAFCTIMPAWAQGHSAGKAFDAISRQPQVASDLRTSLILAMAFMEALCIFGLLIAFMIIGKIA